jgi:cytochrome c-type biogenesis protein CcsB
MKKILNILFSSKTMVLLVVASAVAMGAGTFIEDKYDTLTARTLIYDSRWFEALFILMAINFIGHIQSYQMLRKDKIGGLVFHLAFVIMILGAGITRYFGSEGMMRIREGESSNILFSSEEYLQVNVNDKGSELKKEFQKSFGRYITNNFNENINTTNGEPISIKLKEYIANATEQFKDHSEGGTDILELVVASESGRRKVLINRGEAINLGMVTISFDAGDNVDALKVSGDEGSLKIYSPYEMTRTNMASQTSDTIPHDSLSAFNTKILYSVNGAVFFFTNYHKSAVKEIVKSETDETGFDALIFDVKSGNKTKQIPLMFSPGQVAEFSDFNVGSHSLQLAYGKKAIELPFSIHLNDFILERYPGSESPSSYASEVTVNDPRNNFTMNHRIFMNNVLDYDHYRFFQSSYDQDEQGTILSVNHDYWGTLVSYIGYTLLALGFVITLMTKRSRFLTLSHSINSIRTKRKTMILPLLGIILLANATNVKASDSHVVSKEHAEKFSHLIVQTVDGRFEPVHSMAYDVMHKITRKDKFNIEGKGELDAIQVFMDIIINPEFWKSQPLVYIKEQSVKDKIGVKEGNARLQDFFDEEGNYKLKDAVNEAFRKKPAERNLFDKEVTKVDERVNIFMMVIRGSILKVFPEQHSPNHKWLSWDEEDAFKPLTGVLKVINKDLKLQELNYSNLMKAYFMELIKATQTDDYSSAEKILSYISGAQRSEDNGTILPSEFKINAEINYNKAQVFIFLRDVYSVLSMILLLFAFIDNVKNEKSKIITAILNVSIFILGIAFAYHTFGMIWRAYLLGYAPWSNGYEALLLVSWGTLLAGFIFGRYAKISLAATALLAFFILMTASHSSYDPQLTNLTPVLKSYWLIIHVAVLTISYGFLGLGFVLGLINLFLYTFKNKKNYHRLDLLIQELSWINEMNLTIGLVLATVGTFLGGVWANESWGRYWGWDAKETWALIIVLTYTLVLHLRMIPKMNGKYLFNIASILSFGSVLMTFFGVNYFLSKGMHSYGAGDKAIFPVWAWIAIGCIVLLMVIARIKEKSVQKQIQSTVNDENDIYQ